jgi:hypothetical protein
MDDPAFKHN